MFPGEKMAETRGAVAAVAAKNGAALTDARVRNEFCLGPSPPPPPCSYSLVTAPGAQRVEKLTDGGAVIALKEGAATINRYAAIVSGKGRKAGVETTVGGGVLHDDGLTSANTMSLGGGEGVAAAAAAAAAWAAATVDWDGTMPVGLEGDMTAVERLESWKAAVRYLDQRAGWDAAFKGKDLGVAVGKVPISPPPKTTKKVRAAAAAGGAAVSAVVQKHPSSQVSANNIVSVAASAREGGAVTSGSNNDVDDDGKGLVTILEQREEDNDDRLVSENLSLVEEEENRDEEMEASWVPRDYRAPGEDLTRQWTEKDLAAFGERGEFEMLGGGSYGEKTWNATAQYRRSG